MTDTLTLQERLRAYAAVSPDGCMLKLSQTEARTLATMIDMAIDEQSRRVAEDANNGAKRAARDASDNLWMLVWTCLWALSSSASIAVVFRELFR